MASILGKYLHTLDDKGRLIVPVKLRAHLGDTFVAAAVLDHCISLYSMDEWEKLQSKLAEMPMSKARRLQRYLSSHASEVQVNGQGRILLSRELLAYANIEKNALIVGAGPRAEVWNPEDYEDDMSVMTSEEVEAEFIGLGF